MTSVSLESYVFDLLQKRAVSKLVHFNVKSELHTAARMMSAAGKWTDDLRVLVQTEKPCKTNRSYVRMVHGVPSPRMFAGRAIHHPEIPAKDLIYFFAGRGLDSLLVDAMPDLSSRDDLATWLTSFSTTRFESQLVNALVALFDTPMYQRNAESVGAHLMLKQIALFGAKIDRLAWMTGQHSMTLANAAPVWRPQV
ncbi:MULTISPECIES: hypothetical protein [Pseudomonas syringae group]|uniref:hypothetical protein n=1 Tax=Pseudomonas syringae group TaxID=136849 RepID=UPI000E30D035|nr:MULTISPECIES: hypothetical protein [Pseudomonas syringae group]